MDGDKRAKDSSNQNKQTDTFYRRRLPHWQPAGATIFLTWRLYGSLPQEALDQLAAERQLLEKQPVRLDETSRDRALRHSKRLFALADEMLARNIYGPQWLKDERIAPLVVDALFFHDSSLYMLLAFVVMPNHVHVVLTPLEERTDLPTDERIEEQAGKPAPHMGQDFIPHGEQNFQTVSRQAEALAPHHVPLRRITQSLKGYTAREANRLLRRTGQTFWQDESYDHWVRDEAELGRIVVYIEWDPVRAGLVASPEEWPWSSAWERKWGRLKDRPWQVG
jgi:REP element-mobilizing transposase RayT